MIEGVCDIHIATRARQERDLTLDKCIEICCTKEITASHMKFMTD